MIDKPSCPLHGQKFMGKGGHGSVAGKWYECHPGKSCMIRYRVWVPRISVREPRKTRVFRQNLDMVMDGARPSIR
jgi:hypothetical protein